MRAYYVHSWWCGRVRKWRKHTTAWQSGQSAAHSSVWKIGRKPATTHQHSLHFIRIWWTQDKRLQRMCVRVRTQTRPSVTHIHKCARDEPIWCRHTYSTIDPTQSTLACCVYKSLPQYHLASLSNPPPSIHSTESKSYTNPHAHSRSVIVGWEHVDTHNHTHTNTHKKHTQNDAYARTPRKIALRAETERQVNRNERIRRKMWLTVFHVFMCIWIRNECDCYLKPTTNTIFPVYMLGWVPPPSSRISFDIGEPHTAFLCTQRTTLCTR